MVGVPANRMPHFVKELRGRTFRSWQAEVDGERAARRRRHLRLVTDNTAVPAGVDAGLDHPRAA